MNLVAKQREERKERILKVARRLIAERGFDGVTMRALADESLVSVPTLYNLFGGKDELLAASVEADFSMMLAHAAGGDGEEGLARLLGVTRTMATQLLIQPDYTRSLMSFFWGASDSRRLREAVARALTDGIVAALDQMQARRQLVPWVDTRALGERAMTQIVMTAFEWAREYLPDESLEPAMLTGVAGMILGFARGKAAAELEPVVRKEQARGRVPEQPAEGA